MIQSLKKNDLKNLEKFYDESYGNSHILKNNLHIIWQFKKNPFLKKNKTSIIIYKHHNKIISHLGFIPFRLKFFNSIRKGLWHVSFFTLNEFRGKGLGLELVKFSNKPFDFAMVLSGSEGTKNIYQHIGGRTMGNLKRYINILENEKNIIGFSIIRFENKNEKIKAARIVDLIVKREFEAELISSIIDYCKKKCYFIDFFCTGNFYSSTLKKFGFFNNYYKKLKIPTVFNPIDTNRRPEINFLYADLLKSTKNEILANENNWYLVKSDSDQDRAY